MLVSQGLFSWQLLEPLCPCFVLDLGEVVGPFVDAGSSCTPACSQHGCCPYCSLPSIGGPWNFAFTVKFYPPDPAQLTEDITR